MRIVRGQLNRQAYFPCKDSLTGGEKAGQWLYGILSQSFT